MSAEPSRRRPRTEPFTEADGGESGILETTPRTGDATNDGIGRSIRRTMNHSRELTCSVNTDFRNTVRTVPKQSMLSRLELTSERKQMPKVVGNIENRTLPIEPLEGRAVRPRQVRYQAALPPDRSADSRSLSGQCIDHLSLLSQNIAAFTSWPGHPHSSVCRYQAIASLAKRTAANARVTHFDIAALMPT